MRKAASFEKQITYKDKNIEHIFLSLMKAIVLVILQIFLRNTRDRAKLGNNTDTDFPPFSCWGIIRHVTRQTNRVGTEIFDEL